MTEHGNPRPLQPGTSIEISFIADDSTKNRPVVGWWAGCNHFYSAGLEITSDRLLIRGLGSSTLIGCGTGLEKQDEWLTGFMDSDPHWARADDQDELTLTTGEASIVLHESS